MAIVDEKLYKQEVEELTDFVRNDDGWVELRNILIEKNFILQDMLLVAFAEDEDEMEYGILVTKEKKVFEYSRSTAEGENNINSFEIQELTDINKVLNIHPQVKVAFRMIETGTI